MTFKEKLNRIFPMLYNIIKPLLFQLPPEKAHDAILMLARLSPAFGKLSGMKPHERLKLSVGQTKWSFPVGLAAGLDKNAEALPFFAAQGFGAIECGTITLKSQLGNPKPRMFRYPDEESLRNAMGFPNQGLLNILPRLKSYHDLPPIGGNLGKNKDSSPEESIEELSLLFSTLVDHAQYFVINVSSPNTPGLRALQERSYLDELFSELTKHRQGKDLYLKIAPDLESTKISELAQVASDHKLTGIIATNTTIMPERGIGGVSGKLLKRKADEVRELLLREDHPLELIGVGGFSSAQDIFDFWAQGGKATQIYTAYVYQGAQILKDIQKEILSFLDQHQIKDLDDFFKLDRTERKKLILDRIPGAQHSLRYTE